MTNSPSDIAAQAARGFDLFQCQECAESIRDALKAAGHTGQFIEIRAKGKRDFMICVSFDGGLQTITNNGRHLGARVGDVVFDNLHPNGLPYDAWLGDFDSPAGVEIYATTDF